MRITIQVAARDSAKAWGLLVRHSPGTALPEHVFVVSEEALSALREAGVELKELSREPGCPWSEVVTTVEGV